MSRSTFQKVAREFLAAFESFKREGSDERHFQISDSAPVWLQGSSVMLAIHQALDGRMPDDWTYAATREMVAGIVDHDCDNATAAQDVSHEICDGAVDVYNSARYAWLAAHNGNADFCDEAVSEGLVSDDASMADRIGAGQYLAYQRILAAVIDAIDTEATERDASDDEDGAS